MKINIFYFLVLICLLFVYVVNGQNQEATLLNGLKSDNIDKRFGAYQELQKLKYTEKLVEELIKIVETGKTKDMFIERNSSQWFAIELLGNFKVKNVIVFLIENIEIHDSKYKSDSYQSQETLTIEYYFPCVKSLISIGETAIPLLLSALLKEDDQIKRNIILACLKRFDLQKEINTLLDKTKKEIDELSPLYLPSIEK